MNKKRIWGIAALLAAAVLGLAFLSCGAGEDSEVVFVNKTSLAIFVMTDGSPANLPLDKPSSEGGETRATVTKTGGSITLSNINFNNKTVDSDWDRYIEFDLSGAVGVKEVKKGAQFSSGVIVFKPRTVDTDGSTFDANDNPANIW